MQGLSKAEETEDKRWHKRDGYKDKEAGKESVKREEIEEKKSRSEKKWR